jgi:hypothetical protein
VLAAPVPRLRPTRLEFKRTLPLRLLTHADGSALKEGDVVILQACADDFDDVTVDKQPGRSHQVEVRIVARDALELALNQEQGRVQQELVRLREKEREAREKVAAIEKKLRKGEKLAVEDVEQIIQAEQLQQQIRERVGTPREGLRAEVERVRETLRQNGLRNTNARDRMDQVARELERLAEKELQQIEPRLAEARKQAELLDARARAERRAQLEQKAAQAEKEAKALEALARKEDEAAAKAERQASKEADARAQARVKAEAWRTRGRAEGLREKARDLKNQAARDRLAAEQKPDEAKPRETLADARRQQEEVEKTLATLLQEMEPWSSSREVKAEAGRILQEQKQLRAELDELARQDLAGKTPEELTPQQKADLEALRDNQRRLEERANQLLNKMNRIAKERAEKDPETAKELRDAARQAEEGNLVGQMKNAGEQMARNELNAARRSQREAQAQLQKLLKNLEDRREAELDRLIKKLRQAEQKVEELTKEQEELQKKIKEAGKIGDPAKREEELKKLARRQRALQKKTEEMVKQLSRLRSERARQALAGATEEMGEAQQQLSRGQRDNEKQEDVLDRLDEARRELERARRQAEEELGREQLARFADTLKRVKERQLGHNREAERIQREVQQRGSWSRGLKASLRNLAENQKGLGDEAAELAGKELTGTPVFARQLRRAGDSMRQAARRLVRMVKEPPAAAALPDETVGRHQQQALRRLDQLLEALKEAQQNPQPLNRPNRPNRGGQEGGGGGGREEDGVPPLAQLKLLRVMEKEVRDRTDAFHKKHPDLSKLTPRQKAELQDIHKEQKEVADLFEELMRPAGEKDEAGEKEGDGR